MSVLIGGVVKKLLIGCGACAEFAELMKSRNSPDNRDTLFTRLNLQNLSGAKLPFLYVKKSARRYAYLARNECRSLRAVTLLRSERLSNPFFKFFVDALYNS